MYTGGHAIKNQPFLQIYIHQHHCYYLLLNSKPPFLYVSAIYAGHGSVKVRDSMLDEGDKEYTPCYHFYSNPAFFNDDQNPPGSFYSKDKMVTAI